MRLDIHLRDELTLSLKKNELRIIMACMVESFAAIDRTEYALRIGVPMQAASDLAKELRELMERLEIAQ